MRPRIVCVVGPTASGKTGFALELAARIDAEILSADSRQIYRGLDIGTAKPTVIERAHIRHHGFDLVEPDQYFDAARYRTMARAAIADAHRRHKPIIVAGGTGLYIRVLLHDLCPAPPRAPALRAVLVRWAAAQGPPALHRRLALVDAPAAARIHVNDAMRIVRALEVALLSGRRLSDWQRDHAFAPGPFEALLVGLAVPPVTLDARIAARVDGMLARGWLTEVRTLHARGHADDAPVWRTLGYAQMRAVVEGRCTLAAARDATVLATRRYAKRQRTWFRREPGVVWHDVERERGAVLDIATAFLHAPRIAKG